MEYEKPAKYAKGNVKKSVESIPADQGELIELVINERESAGWSFIQSDERLGFTHLYFTKYVE